MPAQSSKQREVAMTDTAPSEFDSEDWLIVHLNGFASGREYERKQIATWMRGRPDLWDTFSVAAAIEAGEHLK